MAKNSIVLFLLLFSGYAFGQIKECKDNLDCKNVLSKKEFDAHHCLCAVDAYQYIIRNTNKLDSLLKIIGSKQNDDDKIKIVCNQVSILEGIQDSILMKKLYVLVINAYPKADSNFYLIDTVYYHASDVLLKSLLAKTINDIETKMLQGKVINFNYFANDLIDVKSALFTYYPVVDNFKESELRKIDSQNETAQRRLCEVSDSVHWKLLIDTEAGIRSTDDEKEKIDRDNAIGSEANARKKGDIKLAVLGFAALGVAIVALFYPHSH